MLINVKANADVNRKRRCCKKNYVINDNIATAGLLTLETRMVEPFSIYMSKKNTSCYIYKFLSFYECFSPLRVGVLTVDAFPLEVTPCL